MDNNILFYSNKCKFCKQMIKLINDIDNINSYKLICIDNNSKNFPYIQRVPTLLINSIEKPIVGINAFNWIQSRSQFNNNTNNINNNANKHLNPKFNVLLNKKNERLTGSSQETDIYSFISDDKTDRIHSFYNSDQERIYTLPEGEKINKINQKKKLNKLLNLRNQQDSLLFNDIDTKMSSHNDILEEQKQYLNNSKNSDINSRINNVNFSVPLNNSIKTTPNIEFFGTQTPRTVIKK